MPGIGANSRVETDAFGGTELSGWDAGTLSKCNHRDHGFTEQGTP